jgi:hypothetical protein
LRQTFSYDYPPSIIDTVTYWAGGFDISKEPQMVIYTIPEPSTLALAGMGMAGLAMFAMRRRAA